MEINHTVILSKDENGLTLEFVVQKDEIKKILRQRYINKKFKTITTNQLPALYFDYPFCFDILDWSVPTFYTKNYFLAKKIQKDKWRAARKPILEKLDVDYIKALEQADIKKQQEIINQKQVLRDITDTPLLDDLEVIKNTWPEVLKQHVT